LRRFIVAAAIAAAVTALPAFAVRRRNVTFTGEERFDPPSGVFSPNP
jgi:hypothetical protein